MKRLVVLVLALAGCQQCNQVPAPATATNVYNALVAGHCVAAGDDAKQAVADELSRVDRPDWMTCLADGGSVAACGAPCQ